MAHAEVTTLRTFLDKKKYCVYLHLLASHYTHLYSLAGAVASMFWVDAELGSDIYLDGKRFEMICVCVFGPLEVVLKANLALIC